MGFYEFSKKAGFTDYHGREEFNDDRHYDKHWGIYDEPFFSYFAEQLNTIEKPFLSVFFSLTSHPPYHIPAEYENQFPKGELDIHESIAYSDNALSTFSKLPNRWIGSITPYLSSLPTILRPFLIN